MLGNSWSYSSKFRKKWRNLVSFNPLLHAIRNNGIRFFSFWNSKENVSNKVFIKKFFDLLRKKFFCCCTQLCTVRHNGTICSKHQKSQNAKNQCELLLLSYTNDY